MLAFHPDLAWFSQYSQRDGSIPGRFFVPGEAFINRGLRFLFKHQWRKSRGFSRHLIPSPREADKIWEYVLPVQKDSLITDGIKKKLNSAVLHELNRWQKDAIVFKFPRLSEEVPLLHEVFPQSVFVHIIRDGRAVALSNRHKFLRSEPDQMKALSLSADHWKRVVAKIHQEKLAGMNIFEIKYEEFCVAVHSHISNCLKLIGLDERGMPWARIPLELIPTNDKWMEGCTREEKILLDDVLGSSLSEFGYR